MPMLPTMPFRRHAYADLRFDGAIIAFAIISPRHACLAILRYAFHAMMPPLLLLFHV